MSVLLNLKKLTVCSPHVIRTKVMPLLSTRSSLLYFLNFLNENNEYCSLVADQILRSCAEGNGTLFTTGIQSMLVVVLISTTGTSS